MPAYGQVHAKWTRCLAQMLSHFYLANITDPEGKPMDREVQTFMVSCSMLTQSRHLLVAEALNWGADYILWLDADHVFPEDTLARLWSRNELVVGCNYARRDNPTAPTAAGFDEDGKKQLVYTTIEKAKDDVLEEVAHLGFGVCLIDCRVFDLLQLKAEDEGKKSFLPLFHFETEDDGFSLIGEDVFFFDKLRAAGVKVYCDHGVSWDVGHLHERIVTNAHAVVQREKWLERNAEKKKKYLDRAEELEKA